MKSANDEKMNLNEIGDEILKEVNGGSRKSFGSGYTKLVCNKCDKTYSVPKKLADAFILRQQGKCMCGGALKKTEATSMSDIWKF